MKVRHTSKLEQSRLVFSRFDVTESTLSTTLHKLYSLGEVGAECIALISLNLGGKLCQYLFTSFLSSSPSLYLSLLFLLPLILSSTLSLSLSLYLSLFLFSSSLPLSFYLSLSLSPLPPSSLLLSLSLSFTLFENMRCITSLC